MLLHCALDETDRDFPHARTDPFGEPLQVGLSLPLSLFAFNSTPPSLCAPCLQYESHDHSGGLNDADGSGSAFSGSAGTGMSTIDGTQVNTDALLFFFFFFFLIIIISVLCLSFSSEFSLSLYLSISLSLFCSFDLQN